MEQSLSMTLSTRVYRIDVPPRSVSRTTPLSAEISSVYLRGRGCSTPPDCRFRMRSRSRWPRETVHRFNLLDRSVPSVSSGPWYGSVLLRLRGGCLGTSGGGVGGRRCTVKSNRDMMSELCSWTTWMVSMVHGSSGCTLHVPRWGTSSAWRTTSSNSVLDILADTNWLSASKYSFAFAPSAT